MGQQKAPFCGTQAPRGTMGAVTRAFQLGKPLVGPIKGGGVAISGKNGNNKNVPQGGKQGGTRPIEVGTKAPRGTMGTVTKQTRGKA